jgi:hypothetical protein
MSPRATAGSFAALVEPFLLPLMQAGEQLQGVVHASESRGPLRRPRIHVIGVTSNRLLLAEIPADYRRITAVGQVTSVSPEDLASAEAGRRWWEKAGFGEVSAEIAQSFSETLRLQTTDGRSWKLQLTLGEGILGRGGDASMRGGVEALGTWLRRNEPAAAPRGS